MSDDLGEELGRNIPLSEMIQSLRTELAVSMANAAAQTLRFKVEEVELELRIQVTRNRDVEGKLTFGVIQAGAKRSSSQEDVHVFKLTLKPDAPEGQSVLVADKTKSLPKQPSR
jgi:hypothetical protein